MHTYVLQWSVMSEGACEDRPRLCISLSAQSVVFHMCILMSAREWRISIFRNASATYLLYKPCCTGLRLSLSAGCAGAGRTRTGTADSLPSTKGREPKSMEE
jgi:hypothetical protein